MSSLHPRLITMVDKLLQHPPRSVQVALGELFPLDEDQLRAQWNELTEHTSLENAALNIRLVRAEQQCMVCFQKYHPQNQETACPHCKSVGAKIIAGEEFYLESIKEENE
ncbi:MAG: hydrogenase maturation nickel metallochaperone HypA [Anaerolineales bacterium]|nr:hydrogenase maturation nickel metallochaperone HypA [Anaerolineales bacterium]